MSWQSISSLAELCGVATRTVRKRCEGLPERQGDKNAICYESTQALPRILGIAGGDEDAALGSFEAERTRLTKAQADKTEIEVAVLRAELIPAAVVERVQGQMISNTRSRVLSLPVKAAPILVNRKSETDIKTILTEMVHEVLAEMADFSESDYVPERQQTLGATAEADAEPVGGRKAIPKSRGQRRAGPVEH